MSPHGTRTRKPIVQYPSQNPMSLGFSLRTPCNNSPCRKIRNIQRIFLKRNGSYGISVPFILWSNQAKIAGQVSDIPQAMITEVMKHTNFGLPAIISKFSWIILTGKFFLSYALFRSTANLEMMLFFTYYSALLIEIIIDAKRVRLLSSQVRRLVGFRSSALAACLLFGCRTTKIATSDDWLTKCLTMQNVDGVPIG